MTVRWYVGARVGYPRIPFAWSYGGLGWGWGNCLSHLFRGVSRQGNFL